MDYEKLHKETLQGLQRLVSKGEITEKAAKAICPDFIVESEEDDYNWSKINEALQDKYTESYSKELFNWLKSLCHQKHWKPSGEIMDGLNEVINMLADSAVIHENSYLFYIMVNLRKQLKAL